MLSDKKTVNNFETAPHIKIGEKTYYYAITHGGDFHADDVFAGALLNVFGGYQFGNGKTFPIYRDDEGEVIKNLPRLQRGSPLIFDVGHGEYDHHQIDREVRPNGIPYASFGLLWKAIAKDLYSQATIDYIDRKFIAPLDRHDNMGGADPLSFIISSMNAIDPSTITQPDEKPKLQKLQYNKAVKWATDILINQILPAANEYEKVSSYVLSQYDPSHSKWVCVPYNVDFDILLTTDAIAVIYPSSRGGWSFMGLPEPQADGSIRNRYLFPEQFRGHNAELLDMYPELGMKFCHANGFMASFISQEAALAYAADYLADPQ